MPPNITVVGVCQIGQTLEFQVEFTGVHYVPGEKYRLLTLPGVAFTQDEQEIPPGKTSHILTWKSTAPLPAVLTGRLNVELRKTHGVGASPAPVDAFQMNIAPAPTATPTNPAPPTNPATNPTAAPPALPQPLLVQVTNSGTAANWLNGAGIAGALIGLMILIIVLAFLWVVLYVIAPTAFNGLSADTNLPAGQSTVVTTVEQRTVSSDPAVLKAAAEASANITH